MVSGNGGTEGGSDLPREHQELPCNELNTDRRHLPPLPPNPDSISGSGQSAQTSASSTRKQPRWSSYNPALSPPPYSWLLATGHPAETPRRRQLDAHPSQLHTWLHQGPSMKKGRPKQAARQGTVMVCTTRTPNSQVLQPRRAPHPAHDSDMVRATGQSQPPH